MSENDKYYITCAIPYVNGQPHLGHALEFTQTDVIARYQRQQGKDVLLEQGADQHGSKNYKKATELNIEPQVFVDQITESFKRIHKELNISYDRFVATTDPAHIQSSQALWNKINQSGAIYKSHYEGLYCVGCENFVTEDQAAADNNICPDHNLHYERLSEENYFFKLSEYTEQIKQAIESNEFIVTPDTRRNEILQTLEGGLEDISISRPRQKLPWGVPVPNDPEHVMYVWFEAVINYISVIGYPNSPDFAKYWPADVQIIGKDILRHHAAIWPGMLLAAGLPLAKKLHVHGFITSEGKKMSKTLGNVVDPFEAIEQYGADAFRYYLMRHIPSGGDGDFSWQKFENAYNNELGNDLGNLVQRVASMIEQYQHGVIGAIPQPSHDTGAYHEAMEDLQFDRALDAVFELIQGVNQTIELQKPWKIAKESDEAHLQDILSYLAGAILQIASLLVPFMPDTAMKIRQTFAEEVVDKSIGILFPKVLNCTE
ncbi:methionine--tRNA ligase [Candidatus Saccharibacteria bacterium]|nr:methionine--tRNA ligase [Candidatus Saccharibacteria bacterium]